jgi:hypothetical protein
VMGTMGPPSFEKAKFKLSSEKVVIRMRYWWIVFIMEDNIPNPSIER